MNKVEIEKVKLRTLKATMHTVEDTVGNALVSMKYLLLNKDLNHSINAEAQSRLLGIIDDTMDQLRVMSSLNVVNEKPFTKDIFYLDVN